MTVSKMPGDVAKWVEANVPGSIQLRSYQIEAWRNLWHARIEQHRKRGLIHLATGLGKTSVAAVDVIHYLREENSIGRVLFVSHMNDISLQAEQTFRKVDPNLTATFFKSGVSRDAQVTFATFQSLYLSLDDIDADRFDYIIWDEAHHIEADTFSAVRHHFKPKFQLALTATPERSDGRDILNYFGEAVFHKSLAEGIYEGWLSAVDYHIVFDQAVKDAMAKGFEAKSLREIRNLFGIRTRNETISEEVLQRRHDIGLDKAKTIVFCQNIQSAGEMSKLLNGEVYHSDIKPEDRASIFKRFRSGDLQVICTVDMFNEGVDIPDARLIVFLRSTSSRTIFEQQLGRGLRRHPGKSKVTVLDFVANVERINFVRELGRHVSSSHGARGSYNSIGTLASPLDTEPDSGYFDTSNFEFEYQTVELLERYEQIKSTGYLTGDIVVREYTKLGTVAKVAEKFNVSSTAIYKHLKRAGIDTSGHMRKDLTSAQVAEVYYRVGTSTKAGKELGVSPGTVIERLRRGGYEIIDHHIRKYTDEELLSTYESTGKKLRATAKIIGVTHQVVGKHLQALGVDTSKKVTPAITDVMLKEAYAANKGNIAAMVDDLDMPWSKVYMALNKYGYIEDFDGPVTSARAAAAYYKYGTSTKAGQVLGVSSAYISRLAKDARYLRKYKEKTPAATAESLIT